MNNPKSNIPVGYINHNRQKVIQVMCAPGLDLNQSLYRILCQNCGHAYQENEATVRQCACPHCQRGMDER